MNTSQASKGLLVFVGDLMDNILLFTFFTVAN